MTNMILNQRMKEYSSTLHELNGLNSQNFNADHSNINVIPAIDQKFITRVNDNSDFLKKINSVPVKNQLGEKIYFDDFNSLAGITNTDNSERLGVSPPNLKKETYLCQKINFDYILKYSLLDQWTMLPEFQKKLTDYIAKIMARDLIKIGFNGTHRTEGNSNPIENKLLEDIAIGWLQKIKNNSPESFKSEGNTYGENEEFKNIDHLVYTAKRELLSAEFLSDSSMVAITGNNIITDKYSNIIGGAITPSEQNSLNSIKFGELLGGLKAIEVPYFPEDSILITSLNNLSIYRQTESHRISVKNNPRRDRFEHFRSINMDYIVEDYRACALIENIKKVDDVSSPSETNSNSETSN